MCKLLFVRQMWRKRRIFVLVVVGISVVVAVVGRVGWWCRVSDGGADVVLAAIIAVGKTATNTAIVTAVSASAAVTTIVVMIGAVLNNTFVGPLGLDDHPLQRDLFLDLIQSPVLSASVHQEPNNGSNHDQSPNNTTNDGRKSTVC